MAAAAEAEAAAENEQEGGSLLGKAPLREGEGGGGGARREVGGEADR